MILKYIDDGGRSTLHTSRHVNIFIFIIIDKVQASSQLYFYFFVSSYSTSIALWPRVVKARSPQSPLHSLKLQTTYFRYSHTLNRTIPVNFFWNDLVVKQCRDSTFRFKRQFGWVLFSKVFSRFTFCVTKIFEIVSNFQKFLNILEIIAIQDSSQLLGDIG